ncbi:MAG: DUF1573 domain-containing protein [Undibacterium sp.]|nr:DUF1573 domain-containing protein [Opitutaceae bacterium]
MNLTFCRPRAPHRRSLAIWVVLALTPLYATPGAESIAPAGRPRMEFPMPKHDFGSAPKGEIVHLDFKVLNTGTVPLEITDIRPACGCTTAGDWTRRIAPGGSGHIPIDLATAQFAGPIAKTVTVSSNDPDHPTTVLEITGTVWTPVFISQPVVIFPALTQLDQVVSRTVSIRHQVEGPLRLTDLQSDKSTFRPELKEIVPGREFELTITTVPPLRTGTETARITLKSSNSGMPDLTIQAVATVLPAVQVAPSEILFTSAKLLTPEKKYVVVLNHRGGDLKLSDLKTNAAGVQISAPASPDGKQFTITLTFPAGFVAPTAGGMTFSGKTNHPDHPEFAIPIVSAGSR